MTILESIGNLIEETQLNEGVLDFFRKTKSPSNIDMSKRRTTGILGALALAPSIYKMDKISKKIRSGPRDSLISHARKTSTLPVDLIKTQRNISDVIDTTTQVSPKIKQLSDQNSSNETLKLLNRVLNNKSLDIVKGINSPSQQLKSAVDEKTNMSRREFLTSLPLIGLSKNSPFKTIKYGKFAVKLATENQQ